jgi:hypothetical protein
MVPNYVLQRTFHVKFGGGAATAFTIDVDGRQYIVTAKHVVEGIRPQDSLEIWHAQTWNSIKVDLVGLGLRRPLLMSPYLRRRTTWGRDFPSQSPLAMIFTSRRTCTSWASLTG